jgi:hypothetical protein
MCIGEAFIQCAQTAVLLYIFQAGEVNVMNSFPHLRGQKTLLNKESDLVFARPYDLHRLLPVYSARVVFASHLGRLSSLKSMELG